ncbi:MAG: prepilin-type N-terminal cleavage/methylation domain-containing protein [Planctomycetota bacterium]
MIRAISKGRRGGFTLVEVLIAIAVLGALSASVYAFAFELLQTRNAIRERAERDASAALLLDRLESQLAVCVVEGPGGAAGVAGSAGSLTVYGAAVTATGFATEQPGSSSEGLAVLAVRHDERERVVSAGRGLEPFTGNAGWERGTLATRRSTVLRDVAAVRFRFFLGGGWLTTFDSADRGELPEAVEVAIWFGSVGRLNDGRADIRDESDGAPLEETAGADDFAARAGAGGMADLAFGGPGGLGEADATDRVPDVYRVIAVWDAVAAAPGASR